MQNFEYVEITISNSAKGWHWSVMIEREGRMIMVAESDRPLPTVSAAATEAETTIPEKNAPSTHARRNMSVKLSG